MEIALKATSHLAEFIPAGGKLSLNEGSSVGDLLENVGIDSDLVMLIVINGELGDIGSSLGDGMTVELIPPISGG